MQFIRKFPQGSEISNSRLILCPPHPHSTHAVQEGSLEEFKQNVVWQCVASGWPPAAMC